MPARSPLVALTWPLLLVLWFAPFAAVSLDAGEAQPPIARRLAADAEETPDFQRHVLPLLGRLGCNGRECHGSFQGQGGFRLSLFGYDFAADHLALTGGDAPRIDRQTPAKSLILRKPTLAVDHEGGERFQVDGWEYQLLRHWIAAGAATLPEAPAELTHLSVEPAELLFAQPGSRRPLQVVAHWSDGSSEDVTALCRFRSNDDSIATISQAGLVTAAGRGDTHVVAFYDNGIAPVPVIVPVSDAVGASYPPVPTPTKIDELLVAKLRKVGVVPSELCADHEFLRRTSLVITGTLPTAEEVTRFLADKAKDKRGKKIDELLASPAYAAWWGTQLGDLLGNHEENLPVGGEQGLRQEKSALWYDWMVRRLDDNVPYDQLMADILLAVGRGPDQSAAEYYEEMTSYFREQQPADFTRRRTMPYFWTRGRFTPPQPLRFSYALLGIRLECAQCHKHPYDQWTKTDYEQFQFFFEGIGNNYVDRELTATLKTDLKLTADQDSPGYKKLFASLAHQGTTVPWQSVSVPTLERSLKRRQTRAKSEAKLGGGRVFTPKLLGGEEVVSTEYDDVREPLVEWLRAPDNPYFARTLVNRVWAAYFGSGLVDPPDDMNLANPASNEPLLEHLAHEFVRQGYDLKRLHRTIAGSRAYQLSWRPTDSNQLDTRNFSRAVVRRLPAEVAYDALVMATATASAQQAMRSDPAVVRSRAIGVSSGWRRHEASYAVNLFGKPNREGICDCDRSNDPSLLQTIYLRNDAEVGQLIDRKDGWLASITPEQLADHPETHIAAAYLRTFSRPPTAEEASFARQHLASAGSPSAGLRDLLWALLNSKEFLLNH